MADSHAVSVVNGTLRITLQLDADNLSDAQATDLLERYKQHLQQNLKERTGQHP